MTKLNKQFFEYYDYDYHKAWRKFMNMENTFFFSHKQKSAKWLYGTETRISEEYEGKI